MKNYLLLVLLCSIIFIPINSNAQTANPTRPSAADNAYLTQYGYSELEIGYSGDKDTYSIPALLKFSVLKKLEAGVIMSGIINYDGNETKVGDPGLQLKYQFLNNEQLAAAIVGKVGYSNSSSATYTIYAVPSIQTKFAQFDLTGGTSFIKTLTEYKNRYFYAFAISPKVDLPVGFFVEIYGESFSGSNPFYFDFGVGYPVSPDFVFDAGLTLGLNKDAADWIFQIGLTKTLFKFL